jgi:hypothetical protein
MQRGAVAVPSLVGFIEEQFGQYRAAARDAGFEEPQLFKEVKG